MAPCSTSLSISSVFTCSGRARHKAPGYGSPERDPGSRDGPAGHGEHTEHDHVLEGDWRPSSDCLQSSGRGKIFDISFFEAVEEQLTVKT